MKITLKTNEFQKMVAKAIKGAGNNKLLPITSMMLICKNENTQNKITLVTTDTNNTLQICGEAYTGEDFYCVVPVDIFSKLISKLTCDKVTLEVVDYTLKVTGNGTYKISLPVDEEGLVVFPEYSCLDAGTYKPHNIKLTTIKSILAVNKSALSTSAEGDCYCGYYMSDKVITSDENVICFNMLKVCDTPMLISRQMLDLVALFEEEDITFVTDGYNISFISNTVSVTGPLHSGIEEFPIEDICDYLDKAFPSECTLVKSALQSVIDRISLFIEPYDRNGAYFIFSNDGVKVKSKKSSVEELIRYSDSNNFAPFTCCVDVPMLKSQLDAIPTDTFKLAFGDEDAIKLSSGNIVSVIALFEDEELTDNADNE